MTRRALILAPVALLAKEPTDVPPTPRNKVALAANAFFARCTEWANAMNRVHTGTIDASENAAFEPLNKLWRKVLRAHAEWIAR